MISRGAKNLIVLSRSANQERIRPFTTEMAKLGCKVKGVGCDISNGLDLAIALNACARDMPPIRGVIQGAMVLQVCGSFSFSFLSVVFACRTVVNRLVGFDYRANDTGTV